MLHSVQNHRLDSVDDTCPTVFNVFHKDRPQEVIAKEGGYSKYPNVIFDGRKNRHQIYQ